MKLKTLKDIDLSNNYNQKENKKELKAEAVKWVMKSFKDGRPYDEHEMMIDFFNITEEDLK